MSNTLTIVIKGDAGQFTRTIKQVEAGIARAQGATKSFGHSTVSNTQAASAAIRLMEGDVTNLVRAAERFVGQSQVLSGVLKSAFPVIGAVAIAGVLARGVEQVTKFIEAARKMPKAIEDGFRSLDLSGEMAVDELRKTNDQLENQILKLEGKPQNNLAVALDDARNAADKLAKSLMEDQKQVNDLLKTNKISWIVSLITGQDTTGDMADKVSKWEQKRSDAGFDYQQAVRKYGPQSDQAKAAKSTLDQITADAEADMQAEIDYRKPSAYRAGNVTGDQTANLSIAKGYLTELQNGDDLQAEQQRNQADTQKQQKLQHAKELADSQKRAQQKLIEGFRKHLDVIKSEHDLSAAEESDYWAHLAASVKKGSDAYEAAMDEAAKAMIPARRALAVDRDKYLANTASTGQKFVNSKGEEQIGTAQFGGGENDLSKNSDYTRGIAEQSRAITEWLRNLQEAPEIQSANADAMAEASLRMGVATGQISRHDAAIVQARLHTEDYNDTLAKLQNQLAGLPNSGLTPMEQRARASAIQNQITALNGQRAVQSVEDNSAIDMETVRERMKASLDLMIQNFGDVAQKFPAIMNSFVNGMNDELARAITGQRANFAGVFRQAGEGLAKTGLEKVESLILGHAKQQHVWVDNMPAMGSKAMLGGSTASTAMHGLLGWLNNSNWAGKLFGGKLFGAGGVFSHFAAGGDMLGGHPAVVGELGPELLLNPPSAHVVPNHKLGSIGSGASYYIDASGANAADVEMRVQRALVAVHGSAVRTSMAAQHDQAKRRPSGPRARF